MGRDPYRVWQNRLRGTWLGVHATPYRDQQPGETWVYPEFAGYYAGVRRARLETKSGALTVTSASPALYLRAGTPRITHPNTTADFPAGDLSFLHAIPAMGSKFKTAVQSGPGGREGSYSGSLVFQLGP